MKCGSYTSAESGVYTNGITGRSGRFVYGRETICKGMVLLMVNLLVSACVRPHNIRMADTDPSGWSITETADVTFNNTDTVTLRELYVNVRFCSFFGYEKLGLSVKTLSPDGFQWTDTLYIPVAGQLPDIGLYADFEQLYRNNVRLDKTGNYRFIFSPVMPANHVKGVAAVGIRVQ